MENSQEFLKAYIERMLLLQDENTQEKPLSEAELKEIALQTGISEAEWQESRKMLQQYLTAGNNFLQFENWQDALKNFEQALVLNPYHVETHFAMAKAYLKQWQKEGVNSAKLSAEKHIQTILKISPAHQPTIRLKQEFWQTQTQVQQRQKSKKWLWIGFFIVFDVMLALWFMMTYNQTMQKKEEISAQWAKVSLEYERRNELLPKITQIAEKQANVEKKMIETLQMAQKQVEKLQNNAQTLQAEQFADFSQEQENITILLAETMDKLAENPDLAQSELLFMLQDQIEGAENRIKVAKTRYNEKVQEYNLQVQKFPVNLFNFPTLPYYQAKNPE